MEVASATLPGVIRMKGAGGAAAKTRSAEAATIQGCQVCGGYGTILLAGYAERGKTIPESLEREMPCLGCSAGELMRHLFNDFSEPMPKGKEASTQRSRPRRSMRIQIAAGITTSWLR